MRTVAQNEDIQRRIRFLIQRQHDHEKQWWKGREVLLQKQKSRKEKKRELDEVLYVFTTALVSPVIGLFLLILTMIRRSVGAPTDEKEVSVCSLLLISLFIGDPRNNE
jgi:hypothetical protein